MAVLFWNNHCLFYIAYAMASLAYTTLLYAYGIFANSSIHVTFVAAQGSIVYP